MSKLVKCPDDVKKMLEPLKSLNTTDFADLAGISRTAAYRLLHTEDPERRRVDWGRLRIRLKSLKKVQENKYSNLAPIIRKLQRDPVFLGQMRAWAQFIASYPKCKRNCKGRWEHYTMFMLDEVYRKLKESEQCIRDMQKILLLLHKACPMLDERLFSGTGFLESCNEILSNDEDKTAAKEVSY